MSQGIYYFGKKRVACRNGYCVNCKKPRLFDGLRSVMVLHVFFIPLLPFAFKVRYFCRFCQEELGSRRPSRPGILIAGVFCGLALSFIGLMSMIHGPEKDTGAGILAVGVLMMAGLIFLLRKKRHVEYDAGISTVTPLPTDVCPYCGRALFASTKPRCHDCKVNIITR